MKKILIIQAARFGDLVQTRRLILTAGKIAKVHLLLDETLAGLAKLLYPEAKIHAMIFHASPDLDKLSRNENVLAELREIKFDKIINCNYTGLTAAVCRLFAQEKIVGYKPAHDSEGGLLRSPWARLVFRISKMRRYAFLNLVDFWGWFLNEPVAGAAVNPPAIAGGKGIGVVISGRESRRSLPAPVLANVVNVVFNILGKPEIRLFGTTSEKTGARALQRLLNPQAQASCLDLCGKTDWQGLAKEVTGLDLLLTPDTGIMHLAAALGTPVLAFFLSSALVHETGPYGQGHLAWQSQPSCAPCLESAPCDNSIKCLEIFSHPGFGRFLAAALRRDMKMLASLPPGLQLWATGFDGFGQKLELLAGTDENVKKRTILRNLVGNYLKIPGFSEMLGKMPPEITASCSAELFPAEEWMLPEKRYY